MVFDDHKGLTAAIGRYFQWVVWQRCQVHFIRDILGKTAKKDRGKIAAYLKEITRSETVESARKRLCEAVEGLESSHPKVAGADCTARKFCQCILCLKAIRSE